MSLPTRHRDRLSITPDTDGTLAVRGAVVGPGAGQLRRSAIDAIDAAPALHPVVIDLRRCVALDDAALVALICADHHAVCSGRTLVLRGPSCSVRSTIRSRAASLLPLVDGAPQDPIAAGWSLSPVVESGPSCGASCDAVACGGSGSANLQGCGHRTRWRMPHRRPLRPPMRDTA